MNSPTTTMRAIAELTAPGAPYALTRWEVDGRVMQVFAGAPTTLRDLFLRTRAYAERDALVYDGTRWTYGRQWDTVLRAADGLRTRFGVAPGDRVAIAGRNYPEWCWAFWATQLLGAVAVPVNAWLAAPELAAVLADCEPAVIVADRERLDRLATIGHALHGVRGLVGMRAPARDGVLSFEELAGGAATPAIPDAPSDPDAPATIMYTSGTTGRPKGVCATHLNHMSTVLSMRLRAAARAAVAGPGDRSAPGGRDTTLQVFPLFHIAGLTGLTSSVQAGRCVVTMYRWDAHEAVRLIAAEGVRDVTGPAAVVRGLLDTIAHTGADLPTLTSLGSGGSQAPARQVRDTHRLGISPGTGYGLTETTSAIVAVGGADMLERPTSIGRPLPTVEIRLIGPDGAPVRRGEPGEIEVSGPQVSPGYYNRPRATAEAFRDGWFRTGDQAVEDEDGYLYLVGRLKDVVIRGGENIYSVEVEAAIEDHPDVAEAAVVGRPHPTLGEEVCAVVRPRPGRDLDADQVLGHLAGRIAAFKVPTVVRFTDADLPRNAGGKVRKTELRALVEPGGEDR